jgi:transcriptional regulator with XRE-family HTH domain
LQEGPELRGLRRERMRAGLTQQQLADLSSTTQHTVSEAEAGKRLPRTTTVYKLADALGVPIGALFAPEPTRSHLDILSEAVDEMEEMDAEDIAERYEDPLEGMQAATQNARSSLSAARQLQRALATDRVRTSREEEAYDLIERFLNLTVRNAAQARKALRRQRSTPGEVGRPAPEPDAREAKLERLLEEAETVYAQMM